MSRYHLRYDPSFLALQLHHPHLFPLPALLRDSLQSTGRFECLSWRLDRGGFLLRGLQFAQECWFSVHSTANATWRDHERLPRRAEQRRDRTPGLYCLLEFTFLLCEAASATGAWCRRLIVLRRGGVPAVELARLPQARKVRL